MRAASKSAHNALKTLIELGSDVNANGKWKRNALRHSARAGSIKCCNEQIDCGVIVDVRDNYEVTPLHLAAFNGHTKCLKISSIIMQQILMPNRNKAAPHYIENVRMGIRVPCKYVCPTRTVISILSEKPPWLSRQPMTIFTWFCFSHKFTF